MASTAIIEDEAGTSSMHASFDQSSSEESNDSIEPIVSFGLIADIQYADNDDRWNFSKTHLRRYRNALKLVNEACQYWLKRAYPISFILQLGDIIDGIAFTNQTSVQDLNSVLEEFQNAFPNLPVYHIWGNHELYNFPRKDLLNGPLCSFDTKNTSPGHYGTFEVCPKLRIIALDTYDLSALGVEKDSEIYIQAMELLAKHNPNENPNDPTGLRGHQRRFVQFNGGLTARQLDWLKEQLTQAQNRKEKVIITGTFAALLSVESKLSTLFSSGHIPVHPSACDPLDLLWNYKEVLDVFWLFDGTVLAYLAGHEHDGGYFRDRKNIHHVTLRAIVECEPNTNSFATVNVYKDRILIEGVGRISTYEIDCQL